MTVTLTREEAQQVLDCLAFSSLKEANEAFKTLRAKLSEPEIQLGITYEEANQPEPVAWGIANTRPTEKQSLMMVMLDEPEPSHMVVPLYTTPPQREWVGLTEEEMAAAWSQSKGDILQRLKPFARAIEAKLKEKNGF